MLKFKENNSKLLRVNLRLENLISMQDNWLKVSNKSKKMV